MKLSIVLLFVFLNFSSVIGEFKQFNIQLDGCSSIVETELGKCSKTCNTNNSIKIKHVSGNLYQIYRFNDNECISSLNYQFINCSTAPLLNTNPTTTTTSTSTTTTTTTTTSTNNENEVLIYCFDEMSSSSNEDDNNLLIYQQNYQQSSPSNKLLPYNTIFNFVTLFSFLFTLV